MAVSKIGIDFNAFKNVQTPDLNISNTSVGLLRDIPEKANEITNGLLGYGILGTMFLTTFWVLADKSPFGSFGYDNLRATSLTFAICSIFSIVLLSGNFINNLIVVSTCIFMFTLTFGLIIYSETRE